MKTWACVLIGLVLLAYVFSAEAELDKVEWLGGSPVFMEIIPCSDNGFSMGPEPLLSECLNLNQKEGVELGLRSDGVVAWRRIEKKE